MLIYWVIIKYDKNLFPFVIQMRSGTLFGKWYMAIPWNLWRYCGDVTDLKKCNCKIWVTSRLGGLGTSWYNKRVSRGNGWKATINPFIIHSTATHTWISNVIKIFYEVSTLIEWEFSIFLCSVKSELFSLV